jgi:hypothetical protein
MHAKTPSFSVLRWIGEAIPPNSRWYPVFHRYLEVVAGRVNDFGGDPLQVPPSPTGDGGKPQPPCPPHHPPKGEERETVTGKIAALIFDRFGDFEGFRLDTEDCKREFYSREKHIEELAERAWRERLRITVVVGCHHPHRPLTILVHKPPAHFKREE